MSYQPWSHKAQYYETDQMGIIHHSNYIRWFEEARVDFMEQMGLGYDELEAAGIISPVLGILCEYKSMVRFHDVVEIRAMVKEYNGIKLTVGYEICDKNTGELRCQGESRHCFLNKAQRPVSLKKENPAFHEIFLRASQI